MNGRDADSQFEVSGNMGPGGTHQTRERLQIAARTAKGLTHLLQELVSEEQSAGTDAGQQSGLWVELRNAAHSKLSSEDIQALTELADALVQKPDDVLIMVKLSEQAEQLVRLLRAHQRVLELLENTPSSSTIPIA